MGMVVRTNVMAMNANRQLGINNTQVGKSLEKLASGFRINRAADDASGLAISEKMKAQIKGLEQSAANSQDGISLIQTAEGALTEVHGMLNRMVELATKSANGTIQDDVDREAIQREVEDLNSEITRISKSTNFNGINLLDGSLGGKNTYEAALTDVGGMTDMAISGLSSDVKSVQIVTKNNGTSNTDGSATAALDKDGLLTITITEKNGTGAAIDAAGVQAEIRKISGQSDAKFAGTVGDLTDTTGTAVATAETVKTAGDIEGTRAEGFTINFAKGETGITSIQIDSVASTGAIGSTNTDGAVAIHLDEAKSYSAADINKMLSDSGVKGITVGFNGSKTGAAVATGLGLSTAQDVNDGVGSMASGLKLQVGDTNAEYNHVTVGVDDLSAESIGTASVDVSNQDGAGAAVEVIKNAINKVSTNRANLGSLQNRLEYTINNLDTTAENMTSANSRIRDTDMAKEMMNYTKMNVLTQAAQAMLAQANQQPQAILQLLQ